MSQLPQLRNRDRVASLQLHRRQPLVQTHFDRFHTSHFLECHVDHVGAGYSIHAELRQIDLQQLRSPGRAAVSKAQASTDNCFRIVQPFPSKKMKQN